MASSPTSNARLIAPRTGAFFFRKSMTQSVSLRNTPIRPRFLDSASGFLCDFFAPGALELVRESLSPFPFVFRVFRKVQPEDLVDQFRVAPVAALSRAAYQFRPNLIVQFNRGPHPCIHACMHMHVNEGLRVSRSRANIYP